MPTENESLQPIVRDISTLLSLDTYQDMSDEEIDLLIDYKIQLALDSEEQTAKMDAIQQQVAAQASAYQTMAADAHDVLYSELNRQVPWATVAADGTVIQNV